MSDSKAINYTDMSGPALLKAVGNDSGKWAAAFCQHAAKRGHLGIDEGWMIGWFANAMEAKCEIDESWFNPRHEGLGDEF